MATRTITAQAVIKAQDQTSGVFAKIEGRARAMMRSLAAMSGGVGSAGAVRARANEATRRAGQISARNRARADAWLAGRGGGGVAPLGMGALGAGAIAATGVAYGAGKSFLSFADAERSLTRIGITAGATREELTAAMQDAQKLAFDTAQPFQKIVEGMDTLAAQGRTMKEVQDFIPSVARTAQAAGAEVSDIAKSADAVGSHLGITAKEMQMAFDIMAEGGKRGSFELKDMARYLPSLLPAAKALGVEGTKGLSDIVALMQMVRKSSGTSEEAAASMSDIMQKMEIEETTKKFKKFGVDSTAAFAKARKEGRNVFVVLEELLQQATKGDLSKLPQIFGDKEALRFARSIMQDAGRWRQESADMLRTAPGTIAKDIVLVVDNARGRVDQLSTAFSNAARELGALISIPATPFLKEMADQMERVRRAWDDGAISKAIDAAADRWDAKKAKKLRDDVDSRTRAIDEEIHARQAGIDDMDRADQQPVTGQIGRTERARRRAREKEHIDRLRQERASLEAGLDRLSAINTDLGLKESQRRSAASASWLKPQIGTGHIAPGTEYGVGPGRWGFGAGGSPTGEPRFGDGTGPGIGRGTPHPLPPARPSGLSGPITSSDDIRAAFGGKLEAVVTAPVTAQLTGSANVAGQVAGTFTVVAGSSLIALEQQMKTLMIDLKGALNAGNGPGSTGKSSPDAAAGGTGAQ